MLGAFIPGADGRSTVTRKFCVALWMGAPSSATRTLSRLVAACAMAGRQTKMPLLALMLAPAGGLSKLNVRICGGASRSVALFVIVNVAPARMVRLETAVRTGAVLPPASEA